MKRLLLLLLILLSACTAQPTAAPTSVPQHFVPEQTRPRPSATPTAPARTPTLHPSVTTTPQDGGVLSPPAAALAAQEALADRLALPLKRVVIRRIESVQWPDACLGINDPNTVCAQVVTPGLRVWLAAGGKQYEYHTDQAGVQVLLAGEAPLEAGDGPTLHWSAPQEPCRTVQVDERGVTKKLCASEPVSWLWEEDLQHQAEWQLLVANYAAFEADTPGGRITFTGSGSQQANAAEQRSLIAWARLVAQLGEEEEPALHWTRHGGIAGFCDELMIFASGFISTSSCRSKMPPFPEPQRLSAAQIEQLYDWLDTYTGFIRRSPGGTPVPDQMDIFLAFSGAGQHLPEEAEIDAVLQFATQIYTQAGR